MGCGAGVPVKPEAPAHDPSWAWWDTDPAYYGHHRLAEEELLRGCEPAEPLAAAEETTLSPAPEATSLPEEGRAPWLEDEKFRWWYSDLEAFAYEHRGSLQGPPAPPPAAEPPAEEPSRDVTQLPDPDPEPISVVEEWLEPSHLGSSLPLDAPGASWAEWRHVNAACEQAVRRADAGPGLDAAEADADRSLGPGLEIAEALARLRERLDGRQRELELFAEHGVPPEKSAEAEPGAEKAAEADPALEKAAEEEAPAIQQELTLAPAPAPAPAPALAPAPAPQPGAPAREEKTLPRCVVLRGFVRQELNGSYLLEASEGSKASLRSYWSCGRDHHLYWCEGNGHCGWRVEQVDPNGRGPWTWALAPVALDLCDLQAAPGGSWHEFNCLERLWQERAAAGIEAAAPPAPDFNEIFKNVRVFSAASEAKAEPLPAPAAAPAPQPATPVLHEKTLPPFVVLKGFVRQELNGHYQQEAPGVSKSSLRSYWSGGGDHHLYWCEGNGHCGWRVEQLDLNGGVPWTWALAPVALDICDLKAAPGGSWHEWNCLERLWQERATAGIEASAPPAPDFNEIFKNLRVFAPAVASVALEAKAESPAPAPAPALEAKEEPPPAPTPAPALEAKAEPLPAPTAAPAHQPATPVVREKKTLPPCIVLKGFVRQELNGHYQQEAPGESRKSLRSYWSGGGDHHLYWCEGNGHCGWRVEQLDPNGGVPWTWALAPVALDICDLKAAPGGSWREWNCLERLWQEQAAAGIDAAAPPAPDFNETFKGLRVFAPAAPSAASEEKQKDPVAPAVPQAKPQSPRPPLVGIRPASDTQVQTPATQKHPAPEREPLIGFSLAVQDAGCLPPNAVLQVQLGERKRQRTLAGLREAPLMLPVPPAFDEKGLHLMDLHVLYEFASTSVVLHPDRGSYDVALRGSRGEASVRLQVQRHAAARPRPRAAAPPDSETEKAHRYLEAHSLQPYVIALCTGAIQDQPQDPYGFIARQLEALLRPRGDGAASGGTGSTGSEVACGRTELCITGMEGVPEGATVSVRVGGERHNASAASLTESSRLSFPPGLVLQLSVLVREASCTKLQLSRERADYRPQLRRRDGGEMPLSLCIRGVSDPLAKTQDFSAASDGNLRTLDDSNLLGFAKTLIKALAERRPENPFAFMLEHARSSGQAQSLLREQGGYGPRGGAVAPAQRAAPPELGSVSS